MRFFKLYDLFPLYRCRGLAGDVVDDSVDALDLVGDAAGGLGEDLVWNGGVLGGHEIGGHHSAERHGVVVGAEVAHDADGAHVREHGEILVGVDMVFLKLLAPDGVGVPEKLQLLLRDFSDAAHAQAGPGEGLAVCDVVGKPELAAGDADLILKEGAQRLHKAHKTDVLRQAADVVVALYGGGTLGAGLNYVRIDGALGKEFRVAVLGSFLVKDIHKELSDYFTLFLRLGDARKGGEEAFLGVDPDKGQLPAAESGLNFVALVFAHETGVHKNADSLSGNGLGKEGGANGGIHSSGEAENDFFVSHLLAYGFDLRLNEIVHVVVAGGVAVVIEEIFEHGEAVLSGIDLRVELGAHKALLLVHNGGKGAVIGACGNGKALRHLHNAVRVAHEHHLVLFKTLKEAEAVVNGDSGLAVFAGAAGFHLASEHVGHELSTVADSEHGHAELKNLRVAAQGLVGVDAVGAAG